ncbi:sigma 54-interacting transcriptional regulator [Desulforamulus ruminis]|uniref:HTH-type transcriptional regulatory protein TyrR n=1 Tax=Desulforamulus ruminis (strain ATCC 23193 / DSM 2154 / NCIMB 8452 / DL) TaxID=696281 RepID=F6DKE7_DESRL|nr:sigma 54-interacting transcriptional regulator [Desulforamulus ruminis]AEG61564.1 PAS sensor protein [Desulforamulus ruminis DSM 2154]
MNTLRLRIQFEDRVGIVRDVSQVISPRNINIVSLQVLPNNMYLEVEYSGEKEEGILQRELCSIPGVQQVEPIEVMPHEEKERQIRAVLDSVSDGIIAVDRKGKITVFNPACEKILRMSSEQALGKNMSEVLSMDIPMIDSLRNGESYDNREIMITTPRGRHHYLSTGRPIKDQDGRGIGMVAALKDMSQVRDLVYSVTKPSMLTFDDIIYGSEAMERVIVLAKRVARSDSTVMIRGESGTGKELFARAIHMNSPRRNKPFVPLNCAALPDSLLESELFGYADGAFTGAKKGGKQGLFEFAHEGTLFLDEIGELTPHLQAKLLRVLQDGKVRRIGDGHEMVVNVRVIAATNRDLEEMLTRGGFREDLYYRLNVFPIRLPTLRERPEDIPFLVQHFLKKFGQEPGKEFTGISVGALRMLTRHRWVGNVRELENVIVRAINLVEKGEIKPEHIILDEGRFTKRENPHEDENGNPVSLKEAAAQAELDTLQTALKTHGSARKAAKALGVSHTTVLNKIRRFGLAGEKVSS